MRTIDKLVTMLSLFYHNSNTKVSLNLNKMITKSELAELRAMLPRGFYSKLKEMTQLSQTTIYYALNGIRQNDAVIEAAASLIRERQQKTSEIRDMLQPPTTPQ